MMGRLKSDQGLYRGSVSNRRAPCGGSKIAVGVNCYSLAGILPPPIVVSSLSLRSSDSTGSISKVNVIFCVSKGVAYRAQQAQLVGYLAIAGAGNRAGRALTRRRCDRASDFESTGLNCAGRIRSCGSMADSGRSNQASGASVPRLYPEFYGVQRAGDCQISY